MSKQEKKPEFPLLPISDYKEQKKIWYDRLKWEGFNDIEDTNSPKELLKTWHSTYFTKKDRLTPETFESKRQYYQMAEEFLNTNNFTFRLEYLAWKLHAEGLSIVEIVKEAKRQEIDTYKDEVHKMLQRLKKIMLGKS